MKGIVTVLNTPFTDDDRIDVAALRRHTELAIAAGVAGLLVPALAAEVFDLSRDERRLMVETVVETARPAGIPVVGGASAATQAERCRNAEMLAELGCDIALVAQPFETPAQFVTTLREIAAATSLPIMLQDFSATGTGVPVEILLETLAAVPEIGFVKIETTDANAKYTALKQATGGRLHVSGGWVVMQLIEALDRGVDAFMPTALNPIYVRIHQLHAAGERDAAIALFRRMLPIVAFSNQGLDHSIRFFKRLLWRQGVYPNARVRRPGPGFDAYQERIADEVIRLAMALESELA